MPVRKVYFWISNQGANQRGAYCACVNLCGITLSTELPLSKMVHCVIIAFMMTKEVDHYLNDESCQEWAKLRWNFGTEASNLARNHLKAIHSGRPSRSRTFNKMLNVIGFKEIGDWQSGESASCSIS